MPMSYNSFWGNFAHGDAQEDSGAHHPIPVSMGDAPRGNQIQWEMTAGILVPVTSHGTSGLSVARHVDPPRSSSAQGSYAIVRNHQVDQ